ncbi:hypothetical protein [uncultured Rhodoferax sp.]|uniref:hypothetical protein n=1 Tax=uncultured Rhodoferax sp. TaxID=223188 RepID=UPI0025E1A373|nr:hypothetical protein [uncultured Rhodoferax sp.]
MDIKTLESLGVSVEDLTNRIVDQAVDQLLTYTGFDEDGEPSGSYATKFKKKIEEKIMEAVNSKIAAIAEEHLIPRVGEMIEQADMRQTNRYGEPVTPKLTFKEFIAKRAETYMTEDVDYHGQSKADLEAKGESTYNWRNCGPRLTVLMRNYIRDSLETQAKAAVNDVNKVIAANIGKAAQDAIAAAASNLKVSVAA